MNIKEYTECCLNFSRQTAGWYALESYNQYDAVYGGVGEKVLGTNELEDGWRETCDGCYGGISCDWAFHKSEDLIRAEAPQKFVDELLSRIECYFDNEVPAEDIMDALARDFG